MAFPLSVAAAIYLEEYAPKNWFTRLIQLNIANLAGVPSIVYGILGLTVFVRALSLERSILSGALTLSILILPVIVMSAQEAIRAVPGSIREAAYGLGATRWQVVRQQVLPMAMPGILTGTWPSLRPGSGTGSRCFPFRSTIGSPGPRRSSTRWPRVPSSYCSCCC